MSFMSATLEEEVLDPDDSYGGRPVSRRCEPVMSR